jgi:hypothetical protein
MLFLSLKRCIVDLSFQNRFRFEFYYHGFPPNVLMVGKREVMQWTIAARKKQAKGGGRETH